MRNNGVFLGIGCLLLALLWAMPSAAADTPSAAIQARYERLRSFAAEFTQTLSHKESGAVERRRGSLLFKKPLLIRWETHRPHEETLFVTGREIWDYLPDEEVAYRYPLEMVKNSHGIIHVITGQADLHRDFDVKAEGKENGLARLRLYPKAPSPDMVEAQIWVDGDGLIQRARIMDFYGNGNEVRFTRITVDAPAPADRFRFTPPQGVEVEDRTRGNTQGRDLFR